MSVAICLLSLLGISILVNLASLILISRASHAKADLRDEITEVERDLSIERAKVEWLDQGFKKNRSVSNTLYTALQRSLTDELKTKNNLKALKNNFQAAQKQNEQFRDKLASFSIKSIRGKKPRRLAMTYTEERFVRDRLPRLAATGRMFYIGLCKRYYNEGGMTAGEWHCTSHIINVTDDLFDFNIAIISRALDLTPIIIGKRGKVLDGRERIAMWAKLLHESIEKDLEAKRFGHESCYPEAIVESTPVTTGCQDSYSTIRDIRYDESLGKFICDGRHMSIDQFMDKCLSLRT